MTVHDVGTASDFKPFFGDYVEKVGREGHLTIAPSGPSPSQAEMICECEVRRWFVEAAGKLKWNIPTQDHISSLTILLNTPGIRNSEPSHTELPESVVLVKSALEVLVRQLPDVIKRVDNAHRIEVETGAEEYLTLEKRAAIKDLLPAVYAAMDSFHWPTGTRQIYKGSGWARTAQRLANAAKAGWCYAGVKKVGMSKPTSPAILFTKLALARIGYDKTEEAIVKALSRLRQQKHQS